MQIIADLHLHSRYSRATSPNMNAKHLSDAAKVKGLNLLGTGDFTHPVHLEDLKRDLKREENGIYSFNGCNFILSSEISLMYSQGGKGRRIHLVTLAPSFEIVDQINELLSSWGRRDYDGRPIFGKTCIEYADELSKISKDCMLIPAHAWTPYFGVLGSKSGFDSIEECFAEKSKYITAIETGLSSDPAMNWRISSLDKYSLISNSDSHSPYPWRLGREANIFEMGKPDYFVMKKALEEKDSRIFTGTIEVDPGYGKYHYDGHAACKVSFSPAETKKLNGVCPVCGKPLTIGVENRVEELADRPVDFVLKGAPSFYKLIPLHEIVSGVLGVDVASKKVAPIADMLIASFGSELNVLLRAPEKALAELSNANLSSAIMKSRRGEIKVKPGYDGEYGVPIFDAVPEKNKKLPASQKTIFDY